MLSDDYQQILKKFNPNILIRIPKGIILWSVI